MEIGSTFECFSRHNRSSRDSLTRLVTLDRVTRIDAASDFFGVENVPRQAITMGLQTILKVKRFPMSPAAVLALNFILLADDNLESSLSGKQALLDVKLAKSCSNGINTSRGSRNMCSNVIVKEEVFRRQEGSLL